MKLVFDVAIIGGAITGSVLALALSCFSQHKMRIAIIERQPFNKFTQGGFDARSIALAYGTLQKMAKILPLTGENLAKVIEEIATPIQQIQISDQYHFGKTTLKAEELHLPQLGAVVELGELGKQLTDMLYQHQNITIFCPNSITQLERTAEKCELRLTNGEHITTSLLIAADGIQSTLARQCGVKTELVKDYQQSAIIANVELAEPHQYQAFERFTEQGPFALLPLNARTMSLVWCVNDPSTLMSLPDTKFLTALQQQFGWTLGKFLRISKRFVYPLSSQKAQSHIHHRLAIVGNAAQLLHPVAGQGFNLGMRDLFTLAEHLGNVFQMQQDIGHYSVLHQFEQQRQADQQRMMTATSGLISLFSCHFLPVQIVRNAGLFALSHCRLGRNQIAHQALGWG